MPIQFECKHCGTVLKTSEDKAGKRAKCPGCGEIILIPNASGGGAGSNPREGRGSRSARSRRSEPADDYEADDYEADDYEADDYEAAASRGRRRSGGGASKKNCPMCGERISAAATRCRYCGESQSERGRGRRVSASGFEAGEAISTAWTIFQQEWGTCLGAFLLPFVLQFGLNLATQLGVAIVFAGLQNAGGAGPIIAVVVLVAWILGLVFFGLYIQCGQAIVMVNVARNKSKGVGDLFTGGRYVLTLLLNSLVIGLAFIPVGILIGVMSAIAPSLALVGIIILYAGIFVAMLAIWPMTYALVDQDLSGLEPLKTAFQLTSGYRLASLVMFLLLIVVNMAGVLACGVGLLITIPLSMLAMSVAYCRLAGRRVHV